MSPSSVAVPFAHPDALFIDGAWSKSGDGRMIDVLEAGTGALFARVAAAGGEDMARAVTAARIAFDCGSWPHLSHRERASYLEAIADGVSRRTADFRNVWIAETGITVSHAGLALTGMAGAIRSYAALAETYGFVERHRPAAGGVGLLVHEPVGVVAAIIPWNAPLTMIVHKCVPALLAGCTVVLKAAPEAPGAAYLFAEICKDAGLPAGVFNMVTADRDVSDLLVRDARVDKVTFTGSTAVGRHIGAVCAGRVARCTLELGGKSAVIVLDDYDVGKAARTIALGTTFLSGQVCAALTRIIVPRRKHDDLIEALCETFAGVEVGDPFRPETGMGPLVSQPQRDRVELFIASGRAEGAVLACGGGRPAGLEGGAYVEPTVFGRVTNDMTIAREEIFGPVLSVIAYDDEDDAVSIANDSIYGLNGSIFTPDPERALAVARRLRSGSVGQNGSRPDFGIAFGGFKQSGIGREGGAEGLRAFLELKTIVVDEAA